MALYYTLSIQGALYGQKWAVISHWRLDGTVSPENEPVIADALAQAGGTWFNDLYRPCITTNTSLTKTHVEGYDEPTAVAERTYANVGDLSGDICPTFVAKGVRQNRTNTLFRASTHRLPEVREANNVNGLWAYDADVTVVKLALATDWFGEPLVYTPEDSIIEYTFVPVLIRTQYTTGSKANPPIVTTALIPHEICDVGNSPFYGITSQVSRKAIFGA